jgi:hypothetical protein
MPNKHHLAVDLSFGSPNENEIRGDRRAVRLIEATIARP